MPEPKVLRYYIFNENDPLSQWDHISQIKYLRSYLTDLKVQSILEEPYYFDRDYLSEFSTFYSLSSRGYPNTCRRIHFFSIKINREIIENAAGGNKKLLNLMQENYLGFSVIRPLNNTPIGRTVLKWYPDNRSNNRPIRITNPKRIYVNHIVGIALSVEGLAWQQQDTAVGACATVALWSVLHSSALDEWHFVPTTADITRFAHRTASMGARIFPTDGLTIGQIREAIKEAGLEPMFYSGDICGGEYWQFSLSRFSIITSTLIRSGFPILLFAEFDNKRSDLHSVCIVGFRADDIPPEADESGIIYLDGKIKYVYLHDDNIGPSVRFEIFIEELSVSLKPSSPRNVPEEFESLKPLYIVAAVPSDLRISIESLNKESIKISETIIEFIDDAMEGAPDISTSVRFFYLNDYLSKELNETIKSKKSLSRAKLEIIENVAPMSRILGVVRVGVQSSCIIDVLFDTSEGDNHIYAFCTVVYSGYVLKLLKKSKLWSYGVIVNAS